jgi:hypothetical protein
MDESDDKLTFNYVGQTAPPEPATAEQ